ncbi:hypothetical protein [Streptomyces pseudogriseolus]|uniref:hypothetical protein n=1 Tax=Streptomyces pseudogriseolus TaxID=36817 RepID=UPI00366669EB
MSRTSRAKLHQARRRVFVFGSEALSKALQGDREITALIKAAPRLDIPIVTSALTTLEAWNPRETTRQALWDWTLSRIRVAHTDDQVIAMARGMLKAAGLHGHTYAIDAILAAVAGREAEQGFQVTVFTSDVDDMHSIPRRAPRANREGLTRRRRHRMHVLPRLYAGHSPTPGSVPGGMASPLRAGDLR